MIIESGPGNNARFSAQISYDSSAGTGSYLAFSAALTQNPALIIFDNQSNVAITISDDGSTDGKTFIAGEAMVLDLRTNRYQSSQDLTWRIGTQFYGKSAAGAGSFYISVVYAS